MKYVIWCILLFGSVSSFCQERHISKFFEKTRFQEQFKHYKYDNYEKLVVTFLEDVVEFIDLHGAEKIAYFEEVRSSIFPLKLPSFNFQLYIYSVINGASPLEFYIKKNDCFQKILSLDLSYIKEINEDSMGYQIIVYMPEYVSPIISESIIKLDYELPYVFKSIYTVSCLEEPKNYLEKTIQGLLLFDKVGLYEKPKQDKAECTWNEEGDFNGPNVFQFFQKK